MIDKISESLIRFKRDSLRTFYEQLEERISKLEKQMKEAYLSS